MVVQQPTTVVTAHVQEDSSSTDMGVGALIFAILSTICITLCCCWWALPFSIVGLVFGILVSTRACFLSEPSGQCFSLNFLFPFLVQLHWWKGWLQNRKDPVYYFRQLHGCWFGCCHCWNHHSCRHRLWSWAHDNWWQPWLLNALPTIKLSIITLL